LFFDSIKLTFDEMIHSPVRMIAILCFIWIAAWVGSTVEGICSGAIPNGEYESLWSLYNATAGPYWKFDNSQPTETVWTFPSALTVPCTNNWQGLTCESTGVGPDSSCYIIEIDLTGFNLTGRLTEVEFSFSDLEELTLQSNWISGVIPSTMYAVTTLVVLDLYSNNLTGSLSSAVGQLTQIHEFLIEDNLLTGSIPTEIGLLTQSLALEFANNSFSGPLPSELGRLLLLQTASFDNNGISGQLPSQLGNLFSLGQFTASNNLLSGTVPSRFGLLTQLASLDISYNNFQGSIASQLASMTALRSFVIEYNSFTGIIPSEFGLIAGIRNFEIERNRISGPIPIQILNSTALNVFDISDNRITGPIPQEIGLATGLSVFIANSNLLSQTIPTQFGNLTGLTYLLSYNNLHTGEFMSGIIENCGQLALLEIETNYFSGLVPWMTLAKADQLIALDLAKTYFSGPLPHVYPPALIDFFIYDCLFSGPIPSELFSKDVPLISKISVGGNSFTGTLPTEIGSAKGLSIFDASKTLLSGTIPSEIGNSESLEIISLFTNSFSGTIAQQLLYLSGLIYLSLDSNLLSGSLSKLNFTVVGAKLQIFSMESNFVADAMPHSMSELISCVEINVAANFISGTISPRLLLVNQTKIFYFQSNLLSGSIPVGSYSNGFDCGEMESLVVSGNRLRGTIPGGLGWCKRLEVLDVSSNQLTGSLTTELSYVNALEYINVSFNGLIGGLEEFFGSTENSLPRLVSLDGSNNAFTGTLAQSLFRNNRSRLESVVLYNNCFRGSLPSQICDATKLTTLVLDDITTGPSCDIHINPKLTNTLEAKRLLESSIPTCIWDLERLSTLHLSGNGLGGRLPDLRNDSSLIAVSLSHNQLTGDIPLSWQTFGKFRNLLLSSNKLSGELSASFAMSNFTETVDLTVNRLSGDIPEVFYKSHATNILDGNLFQCEQNNKPENDPFSRQYVCGSSALDDSLIAWAAAATALTSAVFLMIQVANVPLSRIKTSHDQLMQLLVEGESISAYLKLLSSCARCCRILMIGYVAFVLPTYVALKLSPEISGLYSTHSSQYNWVGPSGLLRRGGGGGGLLTAALLLAAHSTVVLAVNITYIVISLENLSSQQLTAIQFLLGLFKVLWNQLFISLTLRRLSDFSITARVLMATYLKAFTYLLSPVLATLASDSSCFQYLFTSTGSISATILSKQFVCGNVVFMAPIGPFLVATTCELVDEEVTTETVPVWLYSYQCSSALLENYIPVLLFSFLLSGLLVPFIQWTFAEFINSPFTEQLILPRLPSFIRRSFEGNTLYLVRLGDVAPVRNVENPDKGRLFNGALLLSRHLVNLAVMVTFGLAAPLLAVVVCVDSFTSLVSLYALLRRYVGLWHTADKQQSLFYRTLLEEATNISRLEPGYSLLLIVVFSEVFWTVFVIDMIGDVYGLRAAVISILGPTIGIHCLFLWSRRLRTWFTREGRRQDQSHGMNLNGQSMLSPLVVQAPDSGKEFNDPFLQQL
jgi:hypothetical protein